MMSDEFLGRQLPIFHELVAVPDKPVHFKRQNGRLVRLPRFGGADEVSGDPVGSGAGDG